MLLLQTYSIQAQPIAEEKRIKSIVYQANKIVPVLATTFMTTQIVFSQNETIENIQNGDLAAWAVNVQKNLPNMLFLKPTMVGSETNMTVVTNLHTYYFQLQSEPANSNNQTATYAIHFIYPADSNLTMRNSNPQTNYSTNHYNWNYSFNGAHSIMPRQVFDDGQFTYLQLQPRQTIPAIFAVDNIAGNEAVVNYRREGNYLVIQQIAPQFTLRLGKYHVASLFNNVLIHQLQSQGEG